MTDDATPAKVRLTDGLGPLPEPAGFSAGTHDGALFTLKRSAGKNFAKGAMQPLCEWYSAEQMRAAFEAGRLAERNRCRYPQCVENEDERCPRWLTGECEGPNAKVSGAGTASDGLTG